MKINKFIFHIWVFFVFMWATGITIGTIFIPISLLIAYMILFLLIISKPKIFIKKIFTITKYTPLKYFIFFIAFMLITPFLTTNFNNALIIDFKVIRMWICLILPIIFLIIYISPKYISLKKMQKIFLITYSFILIYGIFKYIIGCISPSFEMSIHYLTTSPVFLPETVNYLSYVVNRAKSIFFEPSFFATFLFVFLPLVYKISFCKFKVLKNTKLNNYFKCFLVLFTWIDLLLTQSPIYILLSIIYTLIFFKDKIFSIKKIVATSFLVIFSFFILYITLNVSSEFQNSKIVSRFQKIISVTSFSDIVLADESLGTRICTSINALIATKKHPFVGVGYANGFDAIFEQYLVSPIPLTQEIIFKVSNKIGGMPANIFFSNILCSGIIGTILLYLFFLKSILQSRKTINLFEGIDRQFYFGIWLSSINFLITTFYWSLLIDLVFWMIFGILCSLIYISKINYNNEKLKKYKNEVLIKNV